jgi:hypothetical protein
MEIKEMVRIVQNAIYSGNDLPDFVIREEKRDFDRDVVYTLKFVYVRTFENNFAVIKRDSRRFFNQFVEAGDFQNARYFQSFKKGCAAYGINYWSATQKKFPRICGNVVINKIGVE